METEKQSEGQKGKRREAMSEKTKESVGDGRRGRERRG